MGFGLIDKVKSIVKDFVLFIFTHQYCLDPMISRNAWFCTLSSV